jgi:hypothetical protein
MSAEWQVPDNTPDDRTHAHPRATGPTQGRTRVSVEYPMNALYRMLLHPFEHERPDDGHRLPQDALPAHDCWPSLENSTSSQHRRASDVVPWYADGPRDEWKRPQR